MTTLIDISRKLESGIAVWPGDTPYQLAPVMSIDDGASVNVTTLTLSAHTGTHVDAPRHFLQDGTPLEQVELLPYWGNAQVVTIKDKKGGALTPADFAHIDLTLAPRVLIHSLASHADPTQFQTEIRYPSPELGPFLASQGIILFGTDAASVDHVDSKSLLGHKGLADNRVAILEGLDLSQVTDGVYELVALPLRIVGGDGSPVRAVLKTIANK